MLPLPARCLARCRLLSGCFDCLLVALPVVVVVGARSVGLLCVALLLGRRRRRGLGFCSPLAAMRSRGRPGYFSLLLLLGGGSWHSSSRCRRFLLAALQLWLFYVFLWWQHQRAFFFVSGEECVRSLVS